MPEKWVTVLQGRAGQSYINERRFSKLTEVSVNERQKPLIFTTLTERISRFLKKKIMAKNENKTNFFFKL